MIDLTNTDSAGQRWRKGDRKGMTNLRMIPRGRTRPKLLTLRLSIGATNYLLRTFGETVNVYRNGFKTLYIGKGDDRTLSNKRTTRRDIALGVWGKEFSELWGDQAVYYSFSTDTDQNGEPVAVFTAVDYE